MKSKAKAMTGILFAISMLIQTVFGDLVAQKDAVGLDGLSALGSRGFLLMLAAITAVWIMSLTILKRVRDKNVNK